jgi:hypothetical protein
LDVFEDVGRKMAGKKSAWPERRLSKSYFGCFLRKVAGRWPDDVRKEISVAGKTPLKEPFWMFFEEDGRKMAGRKSVWPERPLSKSHFG